MKYPSIPIFILATAMSTSTLVVAGDDDDDELVIIEIDDAEGPVPGNKSAVESCFGIN